MKTLYQTVSGVAMGLLAFVLRLVGGWDAALGLMFLLMGLDLLTGVVVAFQGHSARTARGGFDSRHLFAGLSRKLLMVLMVMLGTALDGLLGSDLARLCVIGFYSANEALSIIENASLAGLPFPRGLLKALERFREQQDNTGE